MQSRSRCLCIVSTVRDTVLIAIGVSIVALFFVISFVVFVYRYVAEQQRAPALYTGWVKKVSCCTVIDISKAIQ